MRGHVCSSARFFVSLLLLAVLVGPALGGAQDLQSIALPKPQMEGFISQNVYLFCSPEGLATVVRGSVDREGLARALRLRPDPSLL